MKKTNELAAELTGLLGTDRVRIGEPMARHCSFRVGGPADYFLSVGTAGELEQTLRLLRSADEPVFILGRGTNLLVGDGGYRGAVVTMTGTAGVPVTDTSLETVPDGGTDSSAQKLADPGDAALPLQAVSFSGTAVTVGAGAALSRTAAEARDHGLQGLEFAAGIPGSVGGGLVMNAGAYGGEMKDVVDRVLVLLPDGTREWMTNSALSFGYRHSALKENHGIALQAVLQLQPGDPAQIQAQMEELAGRRREKQPLEYPSAGSTFKRPEGYYAGKLIQDAGLRGYSVGGACVSEKHCGFVINRDHATAAQIRQVIEDVQQRVFEHAGVQLEREVIYLGEF